MRQTNLEIESDPYLGSGKILKQAIKLYGKENFSKTIIEICENKTQLGEREKFYITEYNAIDDPIFYNIHEGGFGGNTLKGLSEDEMMLLRQRRKEIAQKREKDRRERMSDEEYAAYRQRLTENAKKGGEAFKKKGGHSEEFKKSLSERVKGENNPMYGKKPPEATIERLKNGKHDWNKGKTMSQEQKDKISKSVKEKFKSEEMKEKLRNRSKNKKSQSTIENISDLSEKK